MKYEQGFIERQTVRNCSLNYILCAMIFAVESAMILIWHVSQLTGDLCLEKGYLVFYWVAVIGAAIHPVFNYLTQRWLYHKCRIFVQLLALFLLLTWAVLFATYDVLHGNSGAAFTQVLIVTSTMIWMPRGMHYMINALFGAAYVGMIAAEKIGGQIFSEEVINSGIFLLISCVIIHVTDSFLYSEYRASQERLRMQNEQLDMMAEQVRAVHSTMDELRIMRHDLRYYARSVEEKLEQSDYQGIRNVTAEITKGVEHADLKKVLYTYTNIPEVDTILSRCKEWAEKEGIAFWAELPPPDMMEVRDIAILLMNALENAADAIKKQMDGSKRYIKVVGARYACQYYLNISNSYQAGTVVINNRTGLPMASKPGHGYGTKSITAILKKYRAHFRFQADGQEFCLQVLIPVEKEEAVGRPSAEKPEIENIDP